MTTLLERSPANERLDRARQALRTLLVHVQPPPEGLPRLAAAAALARRLDATLIGVGAEFAPPPIFGDPMGPIDTTMLQEMRQALAARTEAAQRAFSEATDGLETHWAVSTEAPTDAVVEEAGAADLIVAGGGGGTDTWRWCDPAEMALRAGRPILVVPPRGGRLVADAVVVGWKDAREARRALGDSLPFLCGAREVLVQEVCEAAERPDAEGRTAKVAAALRRHGVNARGRAVTGARDAVAGELRGAALEVGADLIVSGCYGRTRFGEWLFGGVTRDLLQTPDTFLLLSH